MLSVEKEITSVQNDNVKDIVKLRESKHRRNSRLVIIEDQTALELAVAAGTQIRTVYSWPARQSAQTRQLLEQLAKKGTDIIKVNDKVYAKISYGNQNTGFLALALEPIYELDDLELAPSPLIIILDDIEKSGNLGAIARTADAAGVDLIFSVNSGCDIYSHSAVRASKGTIFSTPIINTDNATALVWLREKKMQLICATPEADLSYADIDYQTPTAIVFGNEQAGVSQFWKTSSDYLISIPMKGSADSLNVSISAAVLLFEVAKQRT